MEKQTDIQSLSTEAVASPLVDATAGIYAEEWKIGAGEPYRFPQQLELELGLTPAERRLANAHMVEEILRQGGIVPEYLSTPPICGSQAARSAAHARAMQRAKDQGTIIVNRAISGL